jgi:hypothetical protein
MGVGGAGHVLEVVDSRRQLARLAKAPADDKQHRVSAGGAVQSVSGGAGERVGVGAQGLGEGGVALDVRPGVGDGVGCGAGELVVLLCGEGVAGGALDELVDTDRLVNVSGGVVYQAQSVQRAQHP